jgi:2-phosphosulfolactate phosphatase
MPLDVYLLPAWTNPADLTNRVVVVIDLLRATTTITQALAAGACEVIPCLEVAEAQTLADQWRKEPSCGGVVLGGERGGQRIPGFDLGNSPAEYTAESVGGKTVIFTTTNGTRAMQLCRQARRVLLGSFNSFSALVAELQGERDLALLCAGTAGLVTAEDVYFAGALVDAFLANGLGVPQNDEAVLARVAWRGLAGRETAERLASHLHDSRGGRNLAQLGMQDDILWAARIDTIDVVAELHPRDWRIRLIP